VPFIHLYLKGKALVSQTGFNICISVCVHAQEERRGLKIRLIFLLSPISTKVIETLKNYGISLECTIQTE